MCRILGLALAAALVGVSSAPACYNDRNTMRTEQEFKRNYEFKSNHRPEETPTYSPSEASPAPLAAGFGAGLVALAGALVTVNVCNSRKS